MDVAASEFYKNYKFASQNQSSQDMVDFYAELIQKFPIISLEDQEDWEGWKIHRRIGDSCQLVVFVTNHANLNRRLIKKYKDFICKQLLVKL